MIEINLERMSYEALVVHSVRLSAQNLALALALRDAVAALRMLGKCYCGDGFVCTRCLGIRRGEVALRETDALDALGNNEDGS